MDYLAYVNMLTVQTEMCFPFEYGFYRDIGVQHQRNIAEVGCGNGYFLKTLSQHFREATYYGYDHCDELIEWAQSADRVQFQKGSAESVPGDTDLLILRLIMHQLEDSKAFIATFANRLPKHCRVVIIDPWDEAFQLTPELPAFNQHLARHRALLSPAAASRDVKEWIAPEMKAWGFQRIKRSYYYVPSLLPGYKQRYRDYMMWTSKIMGCSQAVLDEVDAWYRDPEAYAQMGLFMDCFTQSI